MEITKKTLIPKTKIVYEKKKILDAKFSEPLLKTSPIMLTPRGKKELSSSISNNATVTTDIELNNCLPSNRLLRSRMLQHYNLIWLDSGINEIDPEFHHELDQLKHITGSIDRFSNTDQCISYVHNINHMKTFLIVSYDLASHVIPEMHDLAQLESIYIHTTKTVQDDPWTHQWTKVKGCFDKTQSLLDVLKRDLRQSDRDSLSISVTNTNNVNSLDPSFMYTQILKEILIEQPYDTRERIDFVEFCRDLFHDDPQTLHIIDEFEQDYCKYTPIWWYTRESFLYRMINLALRSEDFEIIIKMGFFLRDVHQQIHDLHTKMVHQDSFPVYRGQTLSCDELEKIKNSDGGLLAFNSFLSTTLNKHTSLSFAKEALRKANSVGVIFEMTINPSILSTSFARVENDGYYKDLEKEILFSMHTVFRIDQIEEIEDRLWCIKLSSANVNDDRNLQRLIGRVRQETKGKSPMHRLSKLLTKAAKFVKAEEVTHLLMKQTSADDLHELGQLYQQLGNIKRMRGEKNEALECYQNALDIQLKNLRWNHTDLAETYKSLGQLYDSLGKSSLALDFYRKSLDIFENQSQPQYENLANLYNDIGALYTHRKESLNALDAYKKALGNEKKFLSKYDLIFVQTYNNIGSTYKILNDLPKALEFYYKALGIYERSSMKNETLLILTYRNMSMTHKMMRDYPQALIYFHKLLEVEQRTLLVSHPLLGSTYRHIGFIHYRMKQYSTSLQYYYRTLEIYEKYLPPNHIDTAMISGHIAEVYEAMKNFRKSITFYEQAIRIGQQIWQENDPFLKLWRTKLIKLNQNGCILPCIENQRL